jgi:AcrR family transcriptional regulator
VAGLAGLYAALSLLWTEHSSRTTTRVVVFGVLLLASGWALARPGVVASEYLPAVLGVLLFIPPWVLGYTAFSGAAWTSWVGRRDRREPGTAGAPGEYQGPPSGGRELSRTASSSRTVRFTHPLPAPGGGSVSRRRHVLTGADVRSSERRNAAERHWEAEMAGSPPGGEATRERILDAAEQLFAHHGFDATPTARVAAEAGVPKGLLFYRFARKIDLLTALFAECMPAAMPHEAGEVVAAGDVTGSLLALLDRLEASRQRSSLVRTILWREADTHPEVARRLHACHDELVGFATEVIGLADPASDPDRRHAAALAWAGTITMALNTKRLGSVDHDLPTVAALLAAGLRASTP